MSEENMSDSYEVGYGKPPKDTQFRKGISGNPKGRPRKTRDFDQELLRQSRATVTINENGSRRRISKHELVITQLINNAIRGQMPATRTYLGHYRVASEKNALQEAQARDLRTCSAEELSLGELEKLASEILQKRELEKKKGAISNAD